MIKRLSDDEFQKTFGDQMIDITNREIDDVIDIWHYVKILVDNNIVDELIYNRKLVEKVYRNAQENYDHVLLPTDSINVFLVIVVDVVSKRILGHSRLDLNEKYGID
ncbi:MAG: hypothetical protein AAF466_04985 [Bacteroidota bacterium]